MVDLKERFVSLGISAGAAEIILNSWASSTRKQYDLALKKWLHFCSQESINPLKPELENVINFLFKKSLEGVGFNTSALSSFFSCINLEENRLTML